MADQKDGIVGEGAMQTMSVAPPDERTPPQTPQAGITHREEMLDAELDRSMDGSDPPSTTQPGGGDESEAHPS